MTIGVGFTEKTLFPWMTVDGYAGQSNNRVAVSPLSQTLQGGGATESVRISFNKIPRTRAPTP